MENILKCTRKNTQNVVWIAPPGTDVTNMVPHYNDCHRMFIFQHGLWLAGGWAVMLENCCSLKATLTQNYVSDQFLVHSPRNSVFRFSPSPFAGQHRHTCYYAANTCSLINTHIYILLCIVLVIMVRIVAFTSEKNQQNTCVHVTYL